MKCDINLPASAMPKRLHRIHMDATLLLGAILLVSSATASGGGLNLLTVLNTNSSANVRTSVDEVFETRRGSVALDVNQVLPKSPTTGMREASATLFKGIAINLGLFSDKQFAGVITSEARPEAGVLSLHARSDGDDIATATMTVTTESYLITIQDIPNAKVYRIVGNTETGVGVITQIDLKLMPPVFDGAPIIPPSR